MQSNKWWYMRRTAIRCFNDHGTVAMMKIPVGILLWNINTSDSNFIRYLIKEYAFLLVFLTVNLYCNTYFKIYTTGRERNRIPVNPGVSRKSVDGASLMH